MIRAILTSSSSSRAILSRPRPKTIGLVSCVKRKGPLRAPARDLYTSPLFRKMRRYAIAHSDRWFILSAKYGLVHPDAMIEPYEVTLKGMRASERRAWAQQVYRQMSETGLLATGNRFLWLAGQAYQEDLAPHLAPFPQCDPLKGMKIGERLRWLTNANTEE